MFAEQIYYSNKYYDDMYEYRHVVLPKEMENKVPKTHLMTEAEWRSIGVQQSHGWIHYMIHQPEPHVLLFKRKRKDVVEDGKDKKVLLFSKTSKLQQ